jgi:hypothetical protein
MGLNKQKKGQKIFNMVGGETGNVPWVLTGEVWFVYVPILQKA